MPDDVKPLRVVSRRYHFSVAGLAYVITTLVLILGAVNGQNNLLFALFGWAVAGLLISGVLSGSALMGVRVIREAPDRASAGEPYRIRYHITNRNWIIPCFGLLIEELPRARTLFGRAHLAHDLPRLGRIIGSAPYIAPRSTITVDVVIEPARRGHVTLNPLRVSSTFPFGVARKSVLFSGEARILIRPRAAELPADNLRHAGVIGATLGSLSPSRTGQEFFALREYQPGDSPRNLAWRATARLDRPVVRSLAHPPGDKVWIALADCDADHSDPVASVAAALAARALANGLAVGLMTPRGELEAMRGGRRQVSLILDALAAWQPPMGSPSLPPPTHDARVLVVHAGEAPDWMPGLATTPIDALDRSIILPTTARSTSRTDVAREAFLDRLRRWLGEQEAPA